MIDTDAAAIVRIAARSAHDIEIDEGEAVVFIIEGQERQRGILILDTGIEHRAIPGEHRGKAAGAIDDMGEAYRMRGHGRNPLVTGVYDPFIAGASQAGGRVPQVASFISAAMVSASCAGLSVRMRAMRGKRMARPDL